MRISVHRGCTD